VNVVHVGVGPISQSDVDLAQACGACIVGFNVRSPPSSVSQAAARADIKVHAILFYLLCYLEPRYFLKHLHPFLLFFLHPLR